MMQDLTEPEAVALYARWLTSDDPSRAWHSASTAVWTDETNRPLRWMAKALRVDPRDHRAWFALAGFAPIRIGQAWHIAAAVPSPDPFDPNSFAGDDVVLVDPETGRASMLGESDPTIVAPNPQPSELLVHTEPMAWLRHWADERVIFFERRRDAVDRGLVIPSFNGEPPSALVVGDINAAPWASLYARSLKIADFNYAKAIRKAVLRSANLPFVEAA